jgi:DNA polymerase III epsilon subunit-like protein
MERFVAFDVETPNAANDRMSAIGIAVIEEGEVVYSFSSLVDPEVHFDAFNVRLTGISEDTVREAPNFAELWPEIGPLLQSGILLAHNATFDLRVLACCLDAYAIDMPRYLRYACTVQMGRCCYPELSNHRLDTLCRYRGIALDHHRADSDSLACARLLLDYEHSGLNTAPFLRCYDWWTRRTVSPPPSYTHGDGADKKN